jgi:uncharacterized protein involved in exopolysaccharide biosynthesis
MNARLPSICWASTADAENAARAGRVDAQDAELDAYVREYYGPPFVAEFVQEALQAAQYQLAQQIAAASERMGQSLNPEHPQLTSMGNSLDEWLRDYARQRAREDLADLQRNRH